jgi:hypothetical protein
MLLLLRNISANNSSYPQVYLSTRAYTISLRMDIIIIIIISRIKTENVISVFLGLKKEWNIVHMKY